MSIWSNRDDGVALLRRCCIYFSHLLNEGGRKVAITQRRVPYESSCHGRRRRVEATTIDDSATKADGPYSREAGDGAYSQPVKASWYHRSSCHGAILGKQYRRL